MTEPRSELAAALGEAVTSVGGILDQARQASEAVQHTLGRLPGQDTAATKTVVQSSLQLLKQQAEDIAHARRLLDELVDELRRQA